MKTTYTIELDSYTGQVLKRVLKKANDLGIEDAKYVYNKVIKHVETSEMVYNNDPLEALGPRTCFLEALAFIEGFTREEVKRGPNRDKVFRELLSEYFDKNKLVKNFAKDSLELDFDYIDSVIRKRASAKGYRRSEGFNMIKYITRKYKRDELYNSHCIHFGWGTQGDYSHYFIMETLGVQLFDKGIYYYK